MDAQLEIENAKNLQPNSLGAMSIGEEMMLNLYFHYELLIIFQ